MNALYRSVENINQICSNIGLFIAGIAMVITTIFITAEIISRNYFNYSFLITTEYTSYLLVLITFMGLAYTLNDDGFIRLDIIRSRLSEKTKNMADIFAYGLSSVFTAISFYFSTQLTLKAYNMGVKSYTISKTPLFIPHTFIIIGLFFLLIATTAGFIDSILRATGKKSEKERGVQP